MRGTVARRALSGAVGVLFLLLSSSCGSADPDELPLPAFPTPTPTADDDGAAVERVGLPTRCEEILAAADLEALLGLPLASVGVRTVVGQPAPAVQRTERVTCGYRTLGPMGDLGRSAPLLDLNVNTYADAAAAAAHWQVNVEAESGAARETPIGSAPAVLFERADGAVLMVVNDTENMTLVLPASVQVGPASSADTLVDLALRILPKVSDTGAGPAAETPSATPAEHLEASES